MTAVTPPDGVCLTVPEVAARLKVHPRTVWRWLARAEAGLLIGFPPPIRLSAKVVRIRASDLENYLALLAGDGDG